MKALLVHSKGSEVVPGEYPKPKPSDDQLLVQVKSVSINPIDHLMASYGIFVTEWPIVLGCDLVGVVSEVGKNVKDFSIGDQVFGYTGLGKPGRGTFAEYCVIPSNIVWKKPTTLTNEEASTFPVALLTACMGLFYNCQIDPSQKYDEPLLIWGGSTSVGLFATQIGKHYGFRVIATSSEKNFDLCKQYGASEVFDYRNGDVAKQINEATGGKLRFALDCAGPQSASVCASLLSSETSSFLAGTSGVPTDISNPNIKVTNVNLGTSLDEPSGVEKLEKLTKDLYPLIESGIVRSLPVTKLQNGFQGIIEGIRLSKEKKVSGSKLVISLE